MKQMISNWKEIESLHDRVVFDKDSNSVIIGGNIAIEDFDQLGVLEGHDVSDYNEIKYSSGGAIYEEIIATNVTQIISIGDWAESSFLPTAANEGEIAFKNVGGIMYMVLYLNTKYYYASAQGKTIRVNGTLTDYGKSYGKFYPAHTEYTLKPFFKWEGNSLKVLKTNGTYGTITVS